jgi:hypothetical protein
MSQGKSETLNFMHLVAQLISATFLSLRALSPIPDIYFSLTKRDYFLLHDKRKLISVSFDAAAVDANSARQLYLPMLAALANTHGTLNVLSFAMTLLILIQTDK